MVAKCLDYFPLIVGKKLRSHAANITDIGILFSGMLTPVIKI